MAKIDWDWSAELKTCQVRIAKLEAEIASQRETIQRLLDRGLGVEFPQRVLLRMEQSLERLRGHQQLIDGRIAELTAGRDGAVPSSEEPDVT
jgi:hypothetical protein